MLLNSTLERMFKRVPQGQVGLGTYRYVEPEVHDALLLAGHTLCVGYGLLFVGLPERDGETLPAFTEQLRLVWTELNVNVIRLFS